MFEKYVTPVVGRRGLEAVGGVKEVRVTFLPFIPNQSMSFEKMTSPGIICGEVPAETLPTGVPVNS